MTEIRNLTPGILEAARTTPLAELPELAGLLAQLQALVTMRLSTPAVATSVESTVDAAGMARIAGGTANWFADAARAGKIPCLHVGHYVRFIPSEVLGALRKNPGLQNSKLRGVRKLSAKTRVVSNKCTTPSAESAPEVHHDMPRVTPPDAPCQVDG